MIEQAIEKLDKELKSFKGDKYGDVIKNGVAAALKDFARQDDEFAQAIVQNDKTLSDCCEQIMKGVGTSISDNEVYKMAAHFYFPGAKVRFQMIIELCTAGEDEPIRDKADGIILDLADFFQTR